MEIFILLAREDCWRDFYLDRRGHPASLQQLELREALLSCWRTVKIPEPWLKGGRRRTLSQFLVQTKGGSLHPGSFSEGDEGIPCKSGILLFSCA